MSRRRRPPPPDHRRPRPGAPPGLARDPLEFALNTPLVRGIGLAGLTAGLCAFIATLELLVGVGGGTAASPRWALPAVCAASLFAMFALFLRRVTRTCYLVRPAERRLVFCAEVLGRRWERPHLAFAELHGVYVTGTVRRPRGEPSYYDYSLYALDERGRSHLLSDPDRDVERLNARARDLAAVASCEAHECLPESRAMVVHRDGASPPSVRFEAAPLSRPSPAVRWAVVLGVLALMCSCVLALLLSADRAP